MEEKKDVFELQYHLEDINPLHFFGPNDSYLDYLRQAYPDTKIIARGTELKVLGEPDKIQKLIEIIDNLYQEVKKYGQPEFIKVKQIISGKKEWADVEKDAILKGFNDKWIKPKTPGQKKLVEAIENQDIVFAVGPAGTGKTYIAVALAVKGLRDKKFKKIVLVRPAVEAGESLGFLPGDLKEKIDPYLRPLYDSLEDMIGPEKLNGYIEKNIIEIVPLAYMRGRTLNHSFIIMDEAQNATETQMKMFLTRLGQESKIIVTGDLSQIDLPKSQKSGLIHATKILQKIEGIGFVFFNAQDVVRHPLVTRIIHAYEINSKNEKS